MPWKEGHWSVCLFVCLFVCQCGLLFGCFIVYLVLINSTQPSSVFLFYFSILKKQKDPSQVLQTHWDFISYLTWAHRAFQFKKRRNFISRLSPCTVWCSRGGSGRVPKVWKLETSVLYGLAVKVF